MLRIGDPHNLHFSIFSGQSKMNLFVTWFESNFYFCYCYQFLKSYLFVSICVEEVEDGFGILLLNIVLGLHKLEVVDEILKRCLAIFICVIGALPK